jgi:Mg/Co/Ni transporter MgtE
VDVSSDGFARRLGPRWLARLLQGEFVAWKDLEGLVSLGPSAGLGRHPGRLADLHPSDLARLAEQLTDTEAAMLLEALVEPHAAAMLEEIRDDRQAALLKRLPRERAVALLRHMQPDAAADVLDEFEAPEADAFLADIDAPRAGLIREALDYPPDSAGGIMNPEFAMAFSGDTVREVVAGLRQSRTEHRLEDWYVFVVGDTRHPRLVGIVSPLDLLAAEGDEQLGSIMQPARRSVRPEHSARTAAMTMAEYNLLILPVVDEQGELLGVISADDALDVLIK